MRAAVYEEFCGAIEVRELPEPRPQEDAVVVRVRACGLCRSDWHGWMGHDSDVHLPHVPGHELAGEVHAVGRDVRRWRIGQRVTVPFCCGCGTCLQCLSGQQHICDRYTQPGFTYHGAFAEYCEIRYADVNLVELPSAIDFVTAAGLGCRFATSFRAVVRQGRVQAGDWVAVHGCGGVGLSAVMIAHALGARVIAVDIQTERLEAARDFGAAILVNAAEGKHVPHQIVDITAGGARVSVDALGSRTTCYNSIACLAKRGRHVQVGLMLGYDTDPPIPMSAVIARELELCGSHGMQAHDYPAMLALIEDGRLRPDRLVENRITLDDACCMLPQMDRFPGRGVTVIDRF